MPTIPRSPEERFWTKVDKTETCWNWTGYLSPEGYGKVGLAGRKFMSAHRFSYQLHHGPIPDGMHVDHKCHVRSCVNPDHLHLVSPSGNAQNRKGSQRRNPTGVRGVREKRKGRFEVRVCSEGVYHWGGYHDTLAEAEAAAIALRRRVMTNNLADREF